MATLDLSLDTGAVPLSRIIDAICSQDGYAAQNAVTPLTKAAFVKQVIAKLVIAKVRDYERSVASQTAINSVTDVTLT